MATHFGSVPIFPCLAVCCANQMASTRSVCAAFGSGVAPELESKHFSKIGSEKDRSRNPRTTVDLDSSNYGSFVIFSFNNFAILFAIVFDLCLLLGLNIILLSLQPPPIHIWLFPLTIGCLLFILYQVNKSNFDAIL